MAFALMAKAFTLNDTTPTNNNQRSSSNPSSMQIAQPGEDHYASNCTVKPRKLDAAYLQKQMQIAQKEEAGIQLTSKEFDFMVCYSGLKETKIGKLECTLENNLQQASSSGTQSDKAPVYDSDGSAEVHHSENCYNNDILPIVYQDDSISEATRTNPETTPSTTK
ncbi:hypothetical protein Tco_1112026 [Tanacetum coccineum]|uniref:Uncharacterized protein n=1 Tax=Tanacetum coccineum TaxID=301880 RepID=A0ABQ5IND1_9ASTR